MFGDRHSWPLTAALLVLLLAFSGVSAMGAWAAGEPDRAFGVHGKVDLGSFMQARATALALDRRGRILVADQPDGLAVRRLTVDGRNDRGFGTGGKAVVFDRNVALASVVALDDQGRVLVGGQRRTRAGGGIVLARLTARGSLDTTFGTGGKVVLGAPVASSGARLVKIVVTPGGVLVLSSNLILARLSPEGKVDESFGGHGYVTLPASSGSGEAGPSLSAGGNFMVRTSAIDLLGRPDGRVLAISDRDETDYHSDSHYFVVSQIGPTGRVERTFAFGGATGRALLPAPDGGFALVGGEIYDESTDTSDLLRVFAADGSPMRSFGQRGTVGSARGFVGQGALFDGRGYVLATDGGLVRLDTLGRRDRSYGACGVTRIFPALTVVAQGPQRLIGLATPSLSRFGGPATTVVFALHARGASDPNSRPVFGPQDPVIDDPNSDRLLLSSLARGHPIVLRGISTPQRARFTATVTIVGRDYGLPRVLARSRLTTQPCRSQRAVLQPSHLLGKTFASVRRALNRHGQTPHLVDISIRLTLRNRAGTRTTILHDELSSA